MRLRRLGAPHVDLYSYDELCEEAKQREAEEELRLFHVAATRARERLILSGVVAPKPSNSDSAGTPVAERIAASFDIDRSRDSSVEIPPPEPRVGLDASFSPSRMAVRVSLASLERAAELTESSRDAAAVPEHGPGPAPLLERRPPPAPRRPLSYTAISAHAARTTANGTADAIEADAPGDDTRASGAEYGIAVHSMLEWSQANGWREPPADLVGRFARNAGLEQAAEGPAALLAPFRAWTGSAFFAERVRAAERHRAEVPLLFLLSGTVLRGSIDLLVENEGAPPLVVDYKTDSLGGADPVEWVDLHYEVQRDVYALAVAEARGATEVEVVHVFLEHPDKPVGRVIGPTGLAEARERLMAAINETAGQQALIRT
jgi:ATP-dependent exoDNAse (exonuclease V) beta subunit